MSPVDRAVRRGRDELLLRELDMDQNAVPSELTTRVWTAIESGVERIIRDWEIA